MANRFIIGKGELLTYDIKPPAIKPSKAHPYTLTEAKARLIPEISNASESLEALPADACPDDVAVAKVDLHPAYIAKSFFPAAFLRHAGLTPVGSRTVRVRPKKDLRKRAPKECETTQLFVAGTREAFARLPSLAEQLQEGSNEAIQFSEFEHVASMAASDRLRGTVPRNKRVFEVGLHMLPDTGAEGLSRAFATFARSRGFQVNTDFDFLVGRMLFVAVVGEATKLEELAKFTMIRVIRPMPALRGARPFPRGTPLSVSYSVPRLGPLSSEPKVAILDGGLPPTHTLGTYIGRYEHSDPAASDVRDYLDHGLGVTSAFLFGPVEPGEEAARPYASVDHFRVLDATSDREDPFELYRTLAHVEEVLLSRRYQFLNLSLGPDLPADDADVHAWTAVLDTTLSDGETLLTVAVGNNGQRDAASALNRIQVPADSVNALSVGAANHTSAAWQRADYSARGPGRSPGRRKPDVVAFGGSPKEYFHVAAPGRKPQLAATMGTSFAAPLTLRTAVGVRAVLGEAVHPLTIKALLIHCAEMHAGAHPDDVGWGRVPADLNEIIMCGDGVARIIYQGLLRPGKYLRAPVALPTAQLTGNVKLSATFCYASPVDVEDAAAYTKAGLSITFRPHVNKTAGKQIKPRSFFTQGEFRTEQEQRTDLGKWETVLHASETLRGQSLKQAYFDIHYNARDGGAVAGASAELIRYALVLTVEARRHANLHEEILAAHAALEAIQPRVSLPVRTSV
ncbi:MAG: family serine peptidase [Polyangiaceae bacterium]|nr:family serine peptidase [Polyangiaceae bacterium]